MIDKDKKIKKLLDLIIKIFGDNAPIINDHWEVDLCAIGLQKNDKLIYITTTGCKKNHYFYECELLLDDPHKPYIVADNDHNVSEKKLLKVISKFFEIEKSN